MMRLFPVQSELETVLCLGAHCDDIEIGCGGTLMRLRSEFPNLRIHCVVFSGNAERGAETRAALEEISGAGSNLCVDVLDFRDGYFPHQFREIKEHFDLLGKTVRPQIVFTHRLEDRHQDHRTLADLTWNTFRDHLVLEYEIPKYEGDLGQPNLFVPLAAEVGARKIRILRECFSSQKSRPWFTDALFNGLMSLRGIESRAPSGLAEAFHARKLVL